MRYLIDTHLLVWQAQGSARLSERTIGILDDADHDVYFSVASVWEVVIKSSVAGDDFDLDATALRQGLLESGYGELEVKAVHALEVARLEPIHRDPFDRILLAQARVEGLVLLTGDERLLAYGYPAQRA